MSYRIFMAPATTPGTITLQASAATWREIAEEIDRTDRTFGARLTERIAGMDSGAPAVRLTFPRSQARKLLQLAGVSG